MYTYKSYMQTFNNIPVTYEANLVAIFPRGTWRHRSDLLARQAGGPTPKSLPRGDVSFPK